MAKKPKNKKIETLTHEGQTRKNIPTAELENFIRDEEAKPKKVDYRRKNNPNETPELYARNLDLDPQLVWKGKDEEDQEPLSVDAVPIYVQEQIHPKAIIEDIKRQSKKETVEKGKETPDLFANWPRELSFEDKIEFYQHDQRWTNRMILGDSLQVMTSLSEKEGLKGQVQCIYFDPPYGIKFGSNWQPSTKSRNVSDNELSREPEIIQAFRDTWEYHESSYLSYLRDRLIVARELLTTSGSLFLQISEENLHLVRLLMDEVFGKENFVSQIYFATTGGFPSKSLSRIGDYILWFSKDRDQIKLRSLFIDKAGAEDESSAYGSIELSGGKRRKLTKDERNSGNYPDGKIFRLDNMCGQGEPKEPTPLEFQSKTYHPPKNSHWKANYPLGTARLIKANRVHTSGASLSYIRYLNDYSATPLTNAWLDTGKAGFASDKFYVVETANLVIQRCILMTTDPGDLVLDPTCGSGTTAAVAEQWGRRWITIDTSRVSLALARAKLMGCKFDHYILKDSVEGIELESEKSGRFVANPTPTNSVNNGFVYERLPHITLGAIANNSEIDAIWERYEASLSSLHSRLNEQISGPLAEWEIPLKENEDWPLKAKSVHAEWLENWIKRQKEIDASIAQNSETEFLYDRPFKKNNVIRVTGPFTVESLSPHRIVPTDADDEALLQQITDESTKEGGKIPEQKSKRLRPKSVEEGETKFLDIVQENLAKAGVQNTKKGERLEFIALDPWLNGRYIQFEGRYMENSKEKKAAIFVGPEYGTVTKSLMSQAAKEAADYFDILVVLGFAFEAHADEDVLNIGRLPVLRARMNNDLHMADRLKSGKSGNLFVVFGEPDIELLKADGDKLKVEIKGVDIFDPTTGDIKASGPDDIACWFIDTDYNDEAFFVRHAYFSGGGPDPFKRLKTTLKAEINEEAWSSLYSTVSRPFEKPSTGRIAVKAINHYGDEVLKVFDV